MQNGNAINLQQKTSYPESDKIQLLVNPEKEGEFALNLRIPEWSEMNTISVNGEELGGIQPETYFAIKRNWKKGDKVEIQMDLRGRLHLLK